jgi:hypothetical protein
MPRSLDNPNKRDTLLPLPPRSSQPELGTNIGKPPAVKRNASTGPAYRQSTLGVPASKKRLPGIGAASSHARLFKVIGDLFLLAGRTEDALGRYVIST